MRLSSDLMAPAGLFNLWDTREVTQRLNGLLVKERPPCHNQIFLLDFPKIQQNQTKGNTNGVGQTYNSCTLG